MSPPQLPDGGDYYSTDYRGAPPPVAGPADHFEVTPENVLQVRAGVLAAAIELRDGVQDLADGMLMEPCGGDPVSADVARAVNYRTVHAENSYINIGFAHAEEGFRTADELAEAARTYGYSEEQIQSSFRGGALDA